MHRWEDNIKIELKEVGCGDVLICLSQVRVLWWAVVNMVINVRVP
jgi:hypothetical protein